MVLYIKYLVPLLTRMAPSQLGHLVPPIEGMLTRRRTFASNINQQYAVHATDLMESPPPALAWEIVVSPMGWSAFNLQWTGSHGQGHGTEQTGASDQARPMDCLQQLARDSGQ